jgi:hypothetical protein
VDKAAGSSGGNFNRAGSLDRSTIGEAGKATDNTAQGDMLAGDKAQRLAKDTDNHSEKAANGSKKITGDIAEPESVFSEDSTKPAGTWTEFLPNNLSSILTDTIPQVQWPVSGMMT